MQTNTHNQPQTEDAIINAQKQKQTSLLKIKKYQFDDLDDEIDQSQEEFMARKSQQSKSMEGKSSLNQSESQNQNPKQDSFLMDESILINPQKQSNKKYNINPINSNNRTAPLSSSVSSLTYMPIQQLSFQEYWNMKYTPYQEAQTAAVQSSTIVFLKSKSIEQYLQKLVTTKQPQQDNWTSLNPLTDVATLQTKEALLKQMKMSLHQEVISKESDEMKLQKCIKKINNSNPNNINNNNNRSKSGGAAEQQQKEGFNPWYDQAYMNEWREAIENYNNSVEAQEQQDRELFQKRKAYESFKGKHHQHGKRQINKQPTQSKPKANNNNNTSDNNNNIYNPQGSFDQFLFPDQNFQVKTEEPSINNNTNNPPNNSTHNNQSIDTHNNNNKTQNSSISNSHLKHLSAHLNHHHHQGYHGSKSHKYYKSRARQKRLQIKSRFRPSQNQTQQNEIKLCQHVFKETIGNMLELLGQEFYNYYQTPQSFKFQLAQTLDKAKREDSSSRFDSNYNNNYYLRTQNSNYNAGRDGGIGGGDDDDQFHNILEMTTSLHKAVPFKQKKSTKKQQKATKKQRKQKNNKKNNNNQKQKQIKQQQQSVNEKIEQLHPPIHHHQQQYNHEQNIEIYFNENSYHNLMQFSREGLSNNTSNPFLNSRENNDGFHGLSFFSDTSRQQKDKQKNTDMSSKNNQQQLSTTGNRQQANKSLQLILHEDHDRDRSLNLSNQLGLILGGGFFDQNDQLKIF